MLENYDRTHNKKLKKQYLADWGSIYQTFWLVSVALHNILNKKGKITIKCIENHFLILTHKCTQPAKEKKKTKSSNGH